MADRDRITIDEILEGLPFGVPTGIGSAGVASSRRPLSSDELFAAALQAPEAEPVPEANIPLGNQLAAALGDALTGFAQGLNPGIRRNPAINRLTAVAQQQAQREAIAQRQQERRSDIIRQRAIGGKREDIARQQQQSQFDAAQELRQNLVTQQIEAEAASQQAASDAASARQQAAFAHDEKVSSLKKVDPRAAAEEGKAFAGAASMRNEWVYGSSDTDGPLIDRMLDQKMPPPQILARWRDELDTVIPPLSEEGKARMITDMEARIGEAVQRRQQTQQTQQPGPVGQAFSTLQSATPSQLLGMGLAGPGAPALDLLKLLGIGQGGPK